MNEIIKHPLKLSKKTAVLLCLAAFALSASSGFAQVQCLPVTNWIHNGTGIWYTAANWSNGVPTSSINAQINNGGTAQVNSSLVPANACSLTLGFDIGNSGNVSLSGNATLSATNGIVVANKGTGTLTIGSGSAVTSGSSSIAVQAGQLWTSNGSVTVNGTWTINGNLILGGGNSTLTVNSGGNVSGTGNLTLSGLSTSAFGVTPSNSGHVTFQGTASLAGHLVVTFSAADFTPNAQYTLLTANSGRSGTFSSVSYINIPPNLCPVIQYNATNVKLQLPTCSP
jgi:T5SS/PEP-CTERM-associated repeat protein